MLLNNIQIFKMRPFGFTTKTSFLKSKGPRTWCSAAQAPLGVSHSSQGNPVVPNYTLHHSFSLSHHQLSDRCIITPPEQVSSSNLAFLFCILLAFITTTHLTRAETYPKPQIPQEEQMNHLCDESDCSLTKLVRVGVN